MKKLLFFAALTFISLLMAFKLSDPDRKTVVIDIGHGGKDHGASVEQVLEKEVNAQIANKIRELNKNADLKLLFTRNGDEFVTVEDRVKIARDVDADIFISIHANYKNNSEIRGIELYHGFNDKSKALALRFKEHLSKTHSINKVHAARFKVVNEAQYPALMIETGFLSNDEDRERLTSEKGQVALAEAIIEVLNDL
ncbi:MAG: N-acetylmuramoyl-L-alanine amidase family protein [Bacteroidota bacterium]